jgi:phosphoribosylformylglycinamidine cyclo-ligase
MKKISSYRDAGVDIDAGNDLVARIKPRLRETYRPGVLTDIGSFAGLFSLNATQYKNPILVSGTDGVGTKLKVAFMAKKYDTIGIDLVAMCVNDIITCGAEPLFFLDTFSCGRLNVDVAEQVIGGIADGCKEAGCALIGGETAEMPDFYPNDEFDLIGFAVGAVEKERLLDGSNIAEGNAIIGVGSSGLHSNGYSLVRNIFFDQMGLSVNDQIEGLPHSIGEELLIPTKIYVRTIQNLLRDLPINGIVNITGGGLLENIPRVFSSRTKVRLFEGSWDVPPIFDLIENHGEIPKQEMYRTFNCGIGMVLICPQSEADNVLARLSGLDERAWIIGEVATKDDPEELSVEFI